MRLLIPIFSLGFLTLIEAQGTFQNTKFDLPPGTLQILLIENEDNRFTESVIRFVELVKIFLL